MSVEQQREWAKQILSQPAPEIIPEVFWEKHALTFFSEPVSQPRTIEQALVFLTKLGCAPKGSDPRGSISKAANIFYKAGLLRKYDSVTFGSLAVTLKSIEIPKQEVPLSDALLYQKPTAANEARLPVYESMHQHAMIEKMPTAEILVQSDAQNALKKKVSIGDIGKFMREYAREHNLIEWRREGAQTGHGRCYTLPSVNPPDSSWLRVS